ncbi:hypothetical protein B7494_g8064 [Chlorociboria aeruginascens]|nr:hypothetical protein B7494_g8064 [Chlorociboria aeruginascens]
MQCHICFRPGGHKLPFICPTDARNALYEHRIQNARVLLENEALDKEISALLLPKSPEDQNQQTAGSGASRQTVIDNIAEKEQSEDRTQQIIAHAEELRANIDKANEQRAKLKAINARRGSELTSAKLGVETRRLRQMEEADKAVRMTKYKWNQGENITATSRIFLCGEAAKLYGLRRARKTNGQEDYKIGGVEIVDLRALNTATPAIISTALSHVVQLIMLSTHYLAIRLPAELTLPHRDYPLPTILPLSASYVHKDIPFPGGTPGLSLNNSPTASRHGEQPAQPRPRPLYIAKPLPLLATEDPAGYALFIEGVTLLAYNIAWLCKSQGVPVGENSSFEDMCAIGRNLFNLLIGSQPRPGPNSRTASSQATPTKNKDKEAEEKQGIPTSIMGHYSHGTTHKFLGSAEGIEFIRSWKLLSPIKLADRLKAKLMSEVANSEWEVLDEDAWAIEDPMGDDGVVVGARQEAEPQRGLGMGIGMGMGKGTQSFMSMRTVMDAVEMIGGGGDRERERERKPGTSGWTKLKPR